MSLHRSQVRDPQQTASSAAAPNSNQSLSRRKCPSVRIVDGLLFGKNELGQILRQVDEISRTLRSDAPGSQKLSSALQLTVSCAVRQTLLEREFRSLALADDLTGLYNRRGFFALATQQLKLARRNSQELLLVFCDVDNLKRINDSYGHAEGDRALIRTASALEQTFRHSDILARLGGDEFAVLAMEAPGQYGQVILDRLGKNLKMSQASKTSYELTLSVGFARFDPKSSVSLGELMTRADRAMYQRKRRCSRL